MVFLLVWNQQRDLCRRHSDFRATPDYFLVNSGPTPSMACKSVVKLRRGLLRILQSTDFWIVLVSSDGNNGGR